MLHQFFVNFNTVLQNFVVWQLTSLQTLHAVANQIRRPVQLGRLAICSSDDNRFQCRKIIDYTGCRQNTTTTVTHIFIVLNCGTIGGKISARRARLVLESEFLGQTVVRLFPPHTYIHWNRAPVVCGGESCTSSQNYLVVVPDQNKSCGSGK